MLKTSIITNTWQCDNCGLETISEYNPYFRFDIVRQAAVSSPSCQADLCSDCIITQVRVPLITDYANNIELTEPLIAESEVIIDG